MTSPPFELSLEERDAVRHILAEVERRGYDDTTLDPVVRALYGRLRERWLYDREHAQEDRQQDQGDDQKHEQVSE